MEQPSHGHGADLARRLTCGMCWFGFCDAQIPKSSFSLSEVVGAAVPLIDRFSRHSQTAPNYYISLLHSYEKYLYAPLLTPQFRTTPDVLPRPWPATN